MLPSLTMAIDFPNPTSDVKNEPAQEPTAVLAGGCFWCTEAVFNQIEGVKKVVSGYSGGERATANYEAVCGGGTGHAEAIQTAQDLLQRGARSHAAQSPGE